MVFFSLTGVEKHESQTEFALTRLGKKLGFGVSHKVSGYQTLVSAPDVFIIHPRMKCYQSLVTKLTCKFAYQSLVSLPIFSFKNTLNQKYLQSFVRFTSMEVTSISCVFLPCLVTWDFMSTTKPQLLTKSCQCKFVLVNHLR